MREGQPVDASPRTEHLKNPTAIIINPQDGTDFLPETLKRLAVFRCSASK